MIFALVHATLGWTIAALAAWALRRRSADARCWAWRMGLLKGPLALLLAVPVVVPVPRHPATPYTLPSPVPFGPPEKRFVAPLESNATLSLRKTSSNSLKLVPARVAKRALSKLPSPETLGTILYVGGVLTVLTIRFRAARRVPPLMPRVEGVLRPRVVVPRGIAPESEAMARAHEEAHVHRRDPLWSLVADLVCATFWFAPPVWLCARGMRAESEAACDAEALQRTGASRRAYADLLLAYAGPAPANALGGPARRLARRILMLERSSKPMSRLALVALVTAGALALLPWEATASSKPKPSLRPSLTTLFPFNVSLEKAMLAVLADPNVKVKIGWRSDQDAALAARDARIAAVWREFRARQDAFARTHSRRDAIPYERNEQKRAELEASKAGGPIPWTPEQKAQLATLALARGGSALWSDPEVSRRLGLTKTQRYALLLQERATLDRLYLDPKLEKGYLPVPKAVEKQSIELQHRLYVAPPHDRPALQQRLDRLQAPYRKDVPHPTPLQRSLRVREDLGKLWKWVEESQPRAEKLLSESQRKTLRSLEIDPSAWQSTSDRRSVDATATERPAAFMSSAPMEVGTSVGQTQ